MSRLDELKKQYPQLNLTMFDLMTRMDPSKSYKYLPLFCKIFNKKFSVYDHKLENIKISANLRENLSIRAHNIEGLNDNQIYVLNVFADHFATDMFTTLKDFISYNEKNKIENNDVTSYNDIEDVRTALSLALIKEMDEELANEVIKEHEDDKWVVVRPLTFAASAKYGASTRWCTTYKKEKQYFERYWRQGVLVYFINKKTGYKFAMFKSLVETDLSFWNAEDQRVDFLSLDLKESDEYLYSVVRNIVKSKNTNKDLCSDEIQEQVHNECVPEYEKLRVVEEDVAYPVPMETQVEEIGETMEERPINEIINNNLQFYDGQIRDEITGEIANIAEIELRLMAARLPENETNRA